MTGHNPSEGDIVEDLRRVARMRLLNPELAIEWQAADEITHLRELLRIGPAMKEVTDAMLDAGERAYDAEPEGYADAHRRGLAKAYLAMQSLSHKETMG